MGSNEIEEVRSILFYETIEYAIKNSPFYRKLYRHARLDYNDYRADITKLPIIDTNTAIKNAAKIMCKRQNVITHQRTGGTTGRPEFFIYRSEEEFRIHEQRCSTRVLSHNREKKTLIMNIQGLTHGLPLFVRSSDVYIVLYDCFDLSLAEEFLLKKHDIPGVENKVNCICAHVGLLKRLTRQMLRKGTNLKTLGVEYLVSTGDYVPQMWRKLLAEMWGATFVDNYSLAEIIGDISQCKICGDYHPGSSLIAEVVSIDDFKPIESGIGLLVLTSLYPYQQAFPLIRYDTGDLFEVIQKKCVDTALYPKGRLLWSIYIKLQEDPFTCLVPQSDIIETVESLPDTNRFNDYDIDASEQLNVEIRSTDTSWESPKFFLEKNSDNGRPHVVLNLELNYDPVIYPSRVHELSSFILEELCRRSPSFDRSISNNQISFDTVFHPPNTISPSKILLR